MFPYTENQSGYLKSVLTGKTFKFDVTSKESRRQAMAALEASDSELAEAIQTRAQRQLGRKLSDAELIRGQWLPETRSKLEIEADRAAEAGAKYNPYKSKLDLIDSGAISATLTPAEREAMEAKAAAWQPKSAEHTGPVSPYAAAIRDYSTRTTHDPDERRRNETLLERFKSLDATWHEENGAKVEQAKREADPVFVNAVENAEATHKYMNLMPTSRQEWVESAAKRLAKLKQDGPEGVDAYWAATRAAEAAIDAELDAAAKSIDGRVNDLKELKAAVLKHEAPVEAAQPAPTLYDTAQARMKEGGQS